MTPTVPPPKIGKLGAREARLAYAMLAPTVLVVAAIVIVPVLANLFLSFKSVTLSDLAGTGLWNLNLTLENFRRVVSSPEFFPTLRVTFLFAFFGTFLSLFMGVLAALLLNVSFAGRNLLRGAFLFPYVAPVIAVAFTWAFMLDPFSGIVNNLLVSGKVIAQPIPFLSQETVNIGFVPFPIALFMVIFFEAWRYFPFAFLFVLARLQAIPRDFYEAAQVDGASSWQQFRFLTLPQLLGVLGTLFLLRFIWTFNKFDDIYLLTGGAAGTKTVTISIYDYGFAKYDLGAASATATVLAIILGLSIMIYLRAAKQVDA
jgi:multiple sugar transport system permease protein